jgi:glutaredoxin
MNKIAPSRRVAGALLVLLASAACAQPIYRIVGPDGKVTFTDRPPVGDEKATALGPGGRSVADGVGSGELSFELRQLMSRYPVTLYTGDDCEPCSAGRSLLNARGVPYTEHTVRTPSDVDVLQRLSGAATVPVLTIGGQRIKGYSNAEWNQYLDAAGYPSASRLPPGYRNPPASPLAPIPEAPAASTPPPQEVAPPPPPPPPPNPAGIIF